MPKLTKTQSQGESVDALLNRISKNYEKLSTRLSEIEANPAIFPPRVQEDVESEDEVKSKPKPR